MNDAPTTCPHCGSALPAPLAGESITCPRCGPRKFHLGRKSWIIILVLLLTPLLLNLVTVAFAKVKPPYGNGSGAATFLFLSLAAIPVCSLGCGCYLAVIGTRRPLLRFFMAIGLALVIAAFQLTVVWAGCAFLMR